MHLGNSSFNLNDLQMKIHQLVPFSKFWDNFKTLHNRSSNLQILANH